MSCLTKDLCNIVKNDKPGEARPSLPVYREESSVPTRAIPAPAKSADGSVAKRPKFTRPAPVERDPNVPPPVPRLHPAVLFVQEGVYPLYDGALLGREGDVAREHFKDDTTVSRNHALVAIVDEQVFIKNVSASGNPISINGSNILDFEDEMELTAGKNEVVLGTQFNCVIEVQSGVFA